MVIADIDDVTDIADIAGVNVGLLGVQTQIFRANSISGGEDDGPLPSRFPVRAHCRATGNSGASQRIAFDILIGF